VSPDGDEYDENFANQADIRGIYPALDHRIIFGVTPAETYGFLNAPTAAQIQQWVANADASIAALGGAGGAVAPVGGGGGAVAVIGGPGIAAGGIVGGAVAGGAVGGGAIGPGGGGAGGVGAVGPVGAAGGPIAPGGGAGAGGLGALALALGVGAGGGGAPADGGGAGVAAAAGAGAGQVAQAGQPSSSADARILPVGYDSTGGRHRPFSDAAKMCSETAFIEWFLKGPRTVLYVIHFIMVFGSALGWHTKWKSEVKLGPDHKDVLQHELICKVLQVAVEFDQLDVSNLMSFELLLRELQLIEDRHGDKLNAGDDLQKERAEEYQILMGLQKTQTCMDPRLKEFLAGELQKSAAVMKERRKAREERTLARKPPPKEK